MTLTNRLVWLVFAPLMVPIGLGIGLRGKPYTLANMRAEHDRLWQHYVYACERN